MSSRAAAIALRAELDAARAVYAERYDDGEGQPLADLMRTAFADADRARERLREARGELDAKDAEIAELRASLANERGKGEPPGDGWRWNAGTWWWSPPDWIPLAYVMRDRPGGWTWYYTARDPILGSGPVLASGTSPTARAAMCAASEAAHKLPDDE